MKSSRDGRERSVMLTRRTATVIISAPLRSNAATISSLSRYFPVPMIRRELNSRPAMMSLSFIKAFARETRRHREKEIARKYLFSFRPVSPWPFIQVCWSDSSKDRHLHGQVLSRVLAEIVEQFRHLGREVVSVVIKTLVFEHHSHGAFTLLQASHDNIQPLDRAAHVGVHFIVIDQFADRALASLDLGDHILQTSRSLIQPGE